MTFRFLHSAFAIVFLCLLSSINAFAQEEKTLAAAKPLPKIFIDRTEFEFGKVKEGDEVSHTFKVKNEGTAELVIHNVSPACGCTASDFSKTLAPGAEGIITLSIKTTGMNGKVDRYADVISNDLKNANLKLWLHLEVFKPEAAAATVEKSILDFSMKNIDGKNIKLDAYRGKVLLLVNVASKCGYTPQYEGLQAIHAKYADQGLVVMGFPANNFMGQEPGTDEEIKTFCQVKYKVGFPLFSKISVKGADIHPLYRFLTSKESNPDFGGDISWNFNKFLVDRNGKVIARFDTREKPESEKITQAIVEALKK